MDVREIGPRIAHFTRAAVFGGAGAIATYVTTKHVSRGDPTGQGTWFVFCATVFGFLVSGVAAGVAFEWHARRRDRLPRARVVVR